MEIRRYAEGDEALWNDFVASSRNGTFLFDRRYMDYHSTRFTDHSLIFLEKGHPIALLPANQEGSTLHSHQGLTYGGLVMGHRLTAAKTCDLMRNLNTYLREEGINHVVYKSVPYIYHRYPCEEDLYALQNVCNAMSAACHVSSALPLDGTRLRWNESRLSGLRKGHGKGLTVRESDDIDTFWNLLNDNLQHKYHAHPVHTAEELHLLWSRFPAEIRLFMVYDGEVAMGGALLYCTPMVVHTQYISATANGKSCGALDVLFDHLLTQFDGKARYFDFGKSSDGDGHDLNEPLIFQKEGFGGRGVCYRWWEWDVNQ